MGVSKKQRWIETRVIVEPDTRFSHRDLEDFAREESNNILNDIKRHVDGVLNSYIDEVFEDVCAFCGYQWDEDAKPEDYNGGCCIEDQAQVCECFFAFDPKEPGPDAVRTCIKCGIKEKREKEPTP